MKNFFAGVLLSVISLAFCLLAVEWFLASLHEAERARLVEKKMGGDLLCTRPASAPELIYERTPGKCRANSHGFRDHHYDYEKDQDVYRIVVIGDSIADGHSVGFGESFAKVLETKLDSGLAPEESKTEVIVLALGGYATTQELYLLEHIAPRYSPDLIVWSYVLNDPAHAIYRSASGKLGDYHYTPRSYTAHFILDKLFKITEKIKAADCNKEYHLLLHCVYRDEVVRNIGRIASYSRQQSVPVIFLIHPIIEEHRNYDSYPLTELHSDLSDIASGAGLQVLDLLDDFSHYDPEELAVSKAGAHDAWHPNAKGHDVVASALLDAIERAGYMELPADGGGE